MVELETVKLTLKCAIRESQKEFKRSGNWKSFDGFVNILLSVVENFGYTKKQAIALYEEIKKEIEEESKNA